MFRQWMENFERCAFVIAQNFQPDIDYREFMQNQFPAILRICQTGHDPAVELEQELKRSEVAAMMRGGRAA